MEYETDIIELLLQRDLTELCYQIFQHLDSKNIANSRLVCHLWRNFIDFQFFELPKGKSCIKQKLIANILDEDFEPKVNQVTLSNEIFDIQVDRNSVVVALKSGDISSFDFDSLKSQWSKKICDSHLQICMNQSRIFAVTSGYDDLWALDRSGHVYIIDRSFGNLIYTLSGHHTDYIYGVRIFKNIILATCSTNGDIKFCQIENLNQIHVIKEEDTYQEIRAEGYTHLDDDENYLVSGSTTGEVIAWDFQTGQKLHTLDSKQRIMSLKVQWPLVVTCSFNYRYDERDNMKKGVKLFNMLTQTLLRRIPSGRSTDLMIQNDLLLVCEFKQPELYNDTDENNVQEVWQDPNRHRRIRIWNLKQLVDSSRKISEVKNKKIEVTKPPLEEFQLCTMHGSSCFITEDQILIRRNYWP